MFNKISYMSLIWKKDKNIELINEFIDSNLVEKGNTKIRPQHTK
ncbi:MAG: hypothetical protein CM15mP91_0840 [Chloroflexota bacterium]|nr:MAG: hypothetical protein CM15mP91_0840 [Chloroflexota bacterium]